MVVDQQPRKTFGHWLFELLVSGGMLALIIQIGCQFVNENSPVQPQGEFQTPTGERALAYFNPATRTYQVYEAFFYPVGNLEPMDKKVLRDPPYVLRLEKDNMNAQKKVFAKYVTDFFIQPRSQSIFVVRVKDKAGVGFCGKGRLILRYGHPSHPSQLEYKNVTVLFEE